ncbi:hypothetical protein D3C79_1022540 [compost metagenome]
MHSNISNNSRRKWITFLIDYFYKAGSNRLAHGTCPNRSILECSDDQCALCLSVAVPDGDIVLAPKGVNDFLI